MTSVRSEALWQQYNDWMDAYDVQKEGGVERSGEREVLMVLVGYGDVALRLVQGLRRELGERGTLDHGVYGQTALLPWRIRARRPWGRR